MPSAIRDLGTRGVPVTGKVDAAVIQMARTFAFQSYFSSTLLQNAILEQPQGQQIVPSTLRAESLAGFAVGLHPSSQCPVAVRFTKGAQAGDSGVVVIKPGMIVRPTGEAMERDGRFSGFEWGLPHGWLGGGNVSLIVFRSSDAAVDWVDRSEMIFHRQRALIVAPAAVPALASLEPNWPIAFPWAKAKQGANQFPQGGVPILSVKPTRVMMLLRGALANPATMRMYFVGSTEFSQLSTGAEDLTAAPPAYDVVWGSWASVASAQYATQYQFQFLPVEAFRLSSISGQLVLVDVTGTLVGMYVDIVRYGEL
ncbi:MAG: hypothetical protein WAV09_03365 [Minisyncoccia bacterium]